MPDQYNIAVSITLEANETKKNAVRDNINNTLIQARANGTITSYRIDVSKITVPETIIGSPL